MLLLPAIYWASRLTGRHLGTLCGILVVSVLFAAVHYNILNPAGAEFELSSFLFRLAASIVFCVLFLFRGFGIAVGTHVAFDLLTQIWFSYPNTPNFPASEYRNVEVEFVNKKTDKILMREQINFWPVGEVIICLVSLIRCPTRSILETSHAIKSHQKVCRVIRSTKDYRTKLSPLFSEYSSRAIRGMRDTNVWSRSVRSQNQHQHGRTYDLFSAWRVDTCWS